MEDSPLNSSNNPGSSTLGQRLKRRLVEPAGVINTQQLHCHYQATQGTAGRLIQRLALPEQVKFRYGSGVLRPTAMFQSLQRQRTESADVFNGQFQVTPHAYAARGATVQRSIQPQPRQFQNNREIEGRNPNRLEISHTNPLQPPATQGATVMTKTLVKATDQNHLTTPASLVEKKPKSDISTPFVKTSRGAGEQKSRGETHRQLRSDRQATVKEVNSLSSNESHSVQRQVDTHSNSNPTVTQTQLETSRALLPPSPETSGTFRISRKATISAVNASNLGARVEGEPQSQKPHDLPLAKAASQLSASTVQRKIDTSANPNSLVTGVEPTTGPKTNPPLVKGIMQKSYKHQDLPLAQSVNSTHPSDSVIQSQVNSLSRTSNPDLSIQPEIEPNKPQNLPLAQGVSSTKPSESVIEDQAVTLPQTSNPIARVQGESGQNPDQNLPLVKGIIQTKAEETKSQSTVNTRSILAVIPHSKSLPLSLQRQQANLPVQLSQEASVASNSTVVSTKPTQLSSSSELNMVWLKSTNGLQVSEGLSTKTPYSQKLPLPLAITQISTNGAIARQTNAVDNSTVQLAMQGNSTTPMSSPETASASPIDVTQVAEQVSRILARQLAVERERRGIGRWH